MVLLLRRLLLLLIIFFTHHALFAQHQDLMDKPMIWQESRSVDGDSLSLISAFKKGRVNGHFRYFFSLTDNTGNLSDYHANAVGGGLRFETAEFRRFRFATSGYYIFNIESSNFTEKDALSGASSRYEVGLFDIVNPDFREEISRLEELYLKYRLGKNNYITFGKQLVNTPFINLQDGRMRPTQVEGIWTEWNNIKNLEIYGGWFFRIAPRSTTRWFRIGETFGIYPTGINPDGSKSGYNGNINSSALVLLGLNYKFNKNWSIQAWNLLADNVFNSVIIQSDATLGKTGHWQVLAGAQTIIQNKVNNGGNMEISKAYFNNDGNAYTFGGRLGLKKEIHEITMNFNRITSHGRYLMPREWGRDPFYTFLPRERNEGFSDLTAWMLQYRLITKSKQWIVGIAAGYYNLPDVKNTKANKYGLPEYFQSNIDIRYRFSGFFEGMEAQLLIVRKINNGATYGNPAFIHNKVDMTLLNTVVNFRF